MPALLISKKLGATLREQFAAFTKRTGIALELIHIPDAENTSLSDADRNRIDIAYMSSDLLQIPGYYPRFCDAVVNAPNLKWVHFMSAGVDQHAFVPDLMKRGISLTISGGANSEPVAQFVLAGMLMLARQFPVWIDAQRRHAWERMRGLRNQPPDLQGQTVMIVGLGTIGMRVAHFCKMLGMHVIGIRQTPRPCEAVDEVHAQDRMVDVLPRCQWLVISCPYNKETHHMIDAPMLAAMPHGACIINIARGAIIDEAALVAALKSGLVGGAYLDVVEHEPLAPESPLWDMPNVILTPHVGAISSGNARRSGEIFLANLERSSRGEPMRNVYTESYRRSA